MAIDFDSAAKKSQDGMNDLILLRRNLKMMQMI
jgi:hypothetical protein